MVVELKKHQVFGSDKKLDVYVRVHEVPDLIQCTERRKARPSVIAAPLHEESSLEADRAHLEIAADIVFVRQEGERTFCSAPSANDLSGGPRWPNDCTAC